MDDSPFDQNAGKTRVIHRNRSLAVHHFIKGKTTVLSGIKDNDRSFLNPPQSDGFQGILGHLPTNDYPGDEISALYRERRHVPFDQSYRGISPFAKDYARIVHSGSFRRLQGKTQLIPAGENEVFRTRLTHSIEVADVAERIATKLNYVFFNGGSYKVDRDIVVCASLLHDIGHPPFGHFGEDVLNERMAKYGGFEGNAQTLRIVTRLENRLGKIESEEAAKSAIDDAEWNPRGLNLTRGTVAAVMKYPFILGENDDKPLKGIYSTEEAVMQWAAQGIFNNPGEQNRTLECQIMDIADDIAYSAYDLEDTLEAGIVTPLDLLAPDDQLLQHIYEDVKGCFPSSVTDEEAKSDIIYTLTEVFISMFDFGDSYHHIAEADDRGNRSRHVFVARTYLESLAHGKHPLVRRQFLETLIERHIESVQLKVNPDHPHLSTLRLEPEHKLRVECLRSFNYHKVISSRRLKMYYYRSREIVGELFDIFLRDCSGSKGRGFLLPDRTREELLSCGKEETPRIARLVADHVSSLTDSEAIRLHIQLKSGQSTAFNAYWR